MRERGSFWAPRNAGAGCSDWRQAVNSYLCEIRNRDPTYSLGRSDLSQVMVSRPKHTTERAKARMAKFTTLRLVNTTRHSSLRAREVDWSCRYVRDCHKGNGRGNR